MDRSTEITEAVFHALTQLQRSNPEAIPAPEVLHQQMCTYLDQTARLGMKLGVPQHHLDEIRYALAALVDEVVVSKRGPLRDFWLARQLQLKYFGENIAGDMFFERLAAIRRDPSRVEVLKIYYLCLMFGFRGKYRVRGGELELLDVIDGVRNELVRAQAIPSDSMLSPNGGRPYEAIADHRRSLLLLWIALGSASFSALLYAWFRLSLLDRADQLVQRLGGLIGS
jgi:type VI secretion system protein ImpK